MPGSQIIFNGPDKSVAALTKAIENDSFIHIDHFDELYTIIEITKKTEKKAKVAIRVNMDTGVYPMWDRFGFNCENGEAWDAINRIMMDENIELNRPPYSHWNLYDFCRCLQDSDDQTC